MPPPLGARRLRPAAPVRGDLQQRGHPVLIACSVTSRQAPIASRRGSLPFGSCCRALLPELARPASLGDAGRAEGTAAGGDGATSASSAARLRLTALIASGGGGGSREERPIVAMDVLNYKRTLAKDGIAPGSGWGGIGPFPFSSLKLFVPSNSQVGHLSGQRCHWINFRSLSSVPLKFQMPYYTSPARSADGGGVQPYCRRTPLGLYRSPARCTRRPSRSKNRPPATIWSARDSTRSTASPGVR